MIGIVTGMMSEARLLARPGWLVACAGAAPEAAAWSLVARGATALISFGIAGGLDAALAPGAVILATAVIGETEHVPTHSAWPTHAAWAERLGLSHAIRAPLAHSPQPLASTAAKAKLHAATQAVAVDMESLAVARVAAEAGIPFLALRAVADPAGRALPPLALGILDKTGRPDLRRLTRGLFAHPEQIPALCRVALDYRAAMASLRRCGAILAKT